MRAIIIAAAAAAFAATPAIAQDDTPIVGAATISADEAAVRAAVEHYFFGGQAGDRERLNAAFETEHGQMVYITRSDDEPDEIRVVPLADFAERLGPVPIDRTGRFASIDIVDDQLAVVRFEIDFATGAFVDYLTLYKINDEWKVVHKVFVRRSKEP